MSKKRKANAPFECAVCDVAVPHGHSIAEIIKKHNERVAEGAEIRRLREIQRANEAAYHGDIDGDFDY